jgi:hypothetical protein
MLPHETTFPHRRRTVLVAVAFGALAALVWPGLDFGRRIAAPCAVILASALVYAFTLGILKLLRFLPRFIFLAYSYVFFYGNIISALLYPLFVSTVLNETPELSVFEKVLWLSGAIPISLASAAGAYVAIDSERNEAQQAHARDVRNARA